MVSTWGVGGPSDKGEGGTNAIDLIEVDVEVQPGCRMADKGGRGHGCHLPQARPYEPNGAPAGGDVHRVEPTVPQCERCKGGSLTLLSL
jgi:hypothetical protein